MSNREDYLDSLLKSVTGPGESSMEAELEGLSEESIQETGRETKRLSADDEFLMKFEQEFQDLDDDEFLKEFEQELANTSLDSDSGTEWENPPAASELEEPAKPVEAKESSEDMMIDTMGFDDFSDIGFGPETENGDDIDSMLKEAMNHGDMEGQLNGSADGDADGSEELLDMLSGMGSDEDLEEIGNMLKAHDGDELFMDDGFDDIAAELGDQVEELDAGSGLGVDPDIAGLFNENGDGKKKKKKGKKDKKEKKKVNRQEKDGLFSKFSKALFEEKEEPVVPESGEMGSISEENMQVLKSMEKKEKKEKKKQAKLEKKQAKKEQKEQKPKKEKPPKPKKEKKPKEKSKPLPKAPVILIYVMAASVLLLVFLGSKLSGYNTGIDQAKSSFDEGDYVAAYQKLYGMDLKEKDLELYDKARMAAYVQADWNSYEAFFGRSMYAEALDALICAIGKFDKYIEEAMEVGAGGELEGIYTQVEGALTAQFGVTMEEARAVYTQPDRSAYTVKLYELLKRAGLSE